MTAQDTRMPTKLQRKKKRGEKKKKRRKDKRILGCEDRIKHQNAHEAADRKKKKRKKWEKRK